MIRNCKIEDISDGKKYHGQDMVKIACEDCRGCSDCCRDMEDTIILDPYDIWNLTTGTQVTLQEYLNKEVQLQVTDGVILPHLGMREKERSCFFLSDQGRCRVHQYRPGICQLFPLGRIYEKGDFFFFLQINQCFHPQKSKIKINKWIGTQASSWYHKYVVEWHRVITEFQSQMKEISYEEQKSMNVALLQHFYFRTYQNFESEIPDRIQEWDERIE